MSTKSTAAILTEPAADGDPEEEQCPVCWGLLCEPVSWPGCSHHFCLMCTLRTRRFQKPSCPLCREPAPRACKVTVLSVDGARAAQVKKLVGFSAYESKRRKLWSDASQAPEELRATPLLSTKFKSKRWQAGTRLGLRFLDPRYREMVRRAMLPGGTRRFAAATRTRSSSLNGEIVAGAHCRLCEIMESNEADDAAWHVIVETGSMCRVIGVTPEDVCQDSRPLLIAELEELEEEEGEDEEEDEDEEEEEEEEEDAEDANGDGTVVLMENTEVEMLQERHLLLEVLHATMQLERARLEQRRLEFMMLLSQRRMLQEIAELNTQVAELAGLTSTITNDTNDSPELSIGNLLRNVGLDPEGTGSASSSSYQGRQPRESRNAAIPTDDPIREPIRVNPVSRATQRAASGTQPLTQAEALRRRGATPSSTPSHGGTDTRSPLQNLAAASTRRSASFFGSTTRSERSRGGRAPR